VRGIGVSHLGDTADIQKEIYEFHSEIEQIVRLTNHPSLVKTADTEASAGAGAIIQMPQNLDGNLKPYLLQPNGSSIEAVLQAIEKKVESIDRTNHLAGLRSVDSRRLSGIAISSEFTQLSSRLATFAT
jgi:tetrahydromethanopterin S-methyltransferase subunit F